MYNLYIAILGDLLEEELSIDGYLFKVNIYTTLYIAPTLVTLADVLICTLKFVVLK